VQQDREGRPFINSALIPPVPRNDPSPGERRNAFNAGTPLTDRTSFQADMIDVFTTFFGRSLADANNLTTQLLPDILIFQIGINPNGFGVPVTDSTGSTPGLHLGNGRRLRDDAIDFALSFYGFSTDLVFDDNGARITDGQLGTTAAFPYIGAANLPLNGPGTGPNP
jgi:hypothetical protein